LDGAIFSKSSSLEYSLRGFSSVSNDFPFNTGNLVSNTALVNINVETISFGVGFSLSISTLKFKVP
jgi:hypothetical protein